MVPKHFFTENFILRWGTHYIKSGKFGGRLQIFKTMEGSQVSSKEEFSRVMEVGYKTLFGSFYAKDESKGGSSFKSQSKTSSTSISVEGGDQKIAAIVTDFNSPTIKYDNAMVGLNCYLSKAFQIYGSANHRSFKV